MAMTAIILAAGEGTRMKSRHPKVMHKLLDRPLVSWVTRAARAAGADRIVVVVGNGAEEVRAHLAAETDVECVEQTERLGTAHATRVAIEAAGVSEGPVVVLNGDLPLIEPETIRAFAQSVSSGEHAAAILTMTPPDPFGYGRIELAEDGSVTRIIEQKDCTPEQATSLLECNAGCYAFDGALLARYIGEVGNQNAQSEYYLPDMVEILRAHGHATTITHCEDYREGLGVNSRIQLAELSALAQAKINEGLMASGVTMLDPKTVWVGPDVTVGRDTELLPMTMLWGNTSVGEGCVVGPNTRLSNCTVANDVTLEETVGTDVTIESGVTCGPRAYLRPRARGCPHRHPRRAQEHRGGPRLQGAPPLLHWRLHHGRPRQHRRRLHYVQLRRRPQEPHHHRGQRLHWLQHHDGCARHHWGGRHHGRQFLHHPRCSR